MRNGRRQRAEQHRQNCDEGDKPVVFPEHFHEAGILAKGTRFSNINPAVLKSTQISPS